MHDHEPDQRTPAGVERREALLIAVSKSGPRPGTLARLREAVRLLGTYNIDVELRIKLSNSLARREANAAASEGARLVIAAGGDATVEAVASGLIGTPAALGVLPLGDHNNVANSLGIPLELSAACTLIARGCPTAIDAGQVEVKTGKGTTRRRAFFETAAVGLGAALTGVGPALRAHGADDSTSDASLITGMPPTCTQIRLDGGRPRWTDTLLITVSNAPQGGSALHLAPDARMDDGLLDVCIYEGLQAPELTARLQALGAGSVAPHPSLWRTRAVSIAIRCAQPLPVAADSRVVGTTPARFTVQPGALLALVGAGPAVTRASTASEPPLQILHAEASRATDAPQPGAVPAPPAAARRRWPRLRRTGLLAVPVAAAVVLGALSYRHRGRPWRWGFGWRETNRESR